ncbi:hypothetical protein [Brevibacterium oceani]|uniref:hypothetical protein n=1 Tax=Brevibacterium oceani TaxID=358099 RepID=UPI0015E6E0A4|nr:hypothetical protein [Brevibacterium oceani]
MTARIEYGIARNPNNYVIPSRTLTDAINQAKEMGKDWLIVERTISDWEEVE